ncbi:MAG: hypothetical protein J6A59_00030 [Lachnospiraceae bacterium]|nr:hypothetical protein [Lachnospiraceae bacterium]
MRNVLCRKNKYILKYLISLVLVISIILSSFMNVMASSNETPDNLRNIVILNGMTTPVETFGEAGETDELKHLLFSKLVYDYMDGYEGKKVKDYVNDNSDLYDSEIWEGQGVTYQNLYNITIGEWEIYKIYNNNSKTGFYAVAFKKDNKVVIAFRGSEMFTEEFALDESNDWTGTDFKFALFNELSAQFEDADYFYETVLFKLGREGYKENRVDITLTGHSLGGALCAYESLKSGKYGYCFDGACGHIIDLTYYYGYLDIDNFTGTDDLDNIMFCNYTDETGYAVADLIQHTNADYMYQIDRKTNLDGLNEYTLIPKTADAGSHIIWSTLMADNGAVSFTEEVNTSANGFTYQPYGPIYLDITKNVIEAGMENVNFDTPWNIIDYDNIDYQELAGSLTGIIKNGRVVLSSSYGGTVTAYDNVGVNSAFDLDTVMYGGKGDDHLIGYVADDVLITGTGNDILDGNLGDDTYVIDNNPGNVTTIKDIGGTKATIILRNTKIKSIKELSVDSDGRISLGSAQYIDLDLAVKADSVEIYTYNQGKLKEIGTLDELGKDMVSRIYKDDELAKFAGNGLNVVFLDGVGTYEISSPDSSDTTKVTNDVKSTTDIEDACDSTVEVTYYDWGMAYADTSIVNPSLFVVVKDGYQVHVKTDEKCDLAVGVIDENNTFKGCDRKYSMKYKNYEVKFDLVSAYGSEQGEVDWVDTLVEGINILDQWFGN